ncbi:amidohydrolase family protein [Flagellimonas pacifica]|uniref:Imidazolonepropionase n=1 Tax=Flagellimonas pacifica TaxID=1247520 RepID=A0A285MVX6_9FLAO|nr:amidohydrolase family protein [Allomuricauda parva]SNZ01350.1 Imidazolonepropionase [Allomuricauda parva]
MRKVNTISLSLCAIFLFYVPGVLWGQLSPKPAGLQSEPILLSGGTIHTGTGEVITKGLLGFKEGRITYLGNMEAKGSDFDEYRIIDITGQHIYPGLILPNSLIGIEEISAVPHSNDKLEQGDINPSIKTVFAFDTGSSHIPTLRFNGILMVESIRSGGTISGTSTVMELDGWNWMEAVHKNEAAIHLRWPSAFSSSYDTATKTSRIKKSTSYDSKTRELEDLFVAARTYNIGYKQPTNLKLASLQGLFDGSKTLVVHASEPKEIIESILFAQTHKVDRIALVTSYSAFMVRDFIRENNIPVILPPTYAYPRRADMAYDAHYKLPFLLTKEGITVALSHTGMLSTSRNLPFYAGMAAAFGLEKEEALKLVTLNPAKILGIDARVGSLMVGKDATLFVSRGDALDVQTNSLSLAFIRGKNIILDGPHQENFKRYSEKFGHGE